MKTLRSRFLRLKQNGMPLLLHENQEKDMLQKGYLKLYDGQFVCWHKLDELEVFCGTDAENLG